MGLIPISASSNFGYYIPPGLEKHTIPAVLGNKNDIMKQGWVSLSHGGFIFPSSLIGFKVLPFHFQLYYGALPELHLSLVRV